MWSENVRWLFRGPFLRSVCTANSVVECILCLSTDCIAHVAKPEGDKKKRGRPTKTWWKTCNKDLAEKEITWKERYY